MPGTFRTGHFFVRCFYLWSFEKGRAFVIYFWENYISLLRSSFTENLLDAGCDEAGRGCLAGPVFAAAVILPPTFHHPLLNDSKQLSEKQRNELRPVIEEVALSYAVASLCNLEIDRLNILQASLTCMHEAIKKLCVPPQLLLIDGNRFHPYQAVLHHCIVQGDGLYASIAAASVLAKTARDAYMQHLHHQHPEYNWAQNKGYGTKQHQQALLKWGPTPYHRKSFRLVYS